MNKQKKCPIAIYYCGGTVGMQKDKKTGALVPFNLDNLKVLMPEMDDLHASISLFKHSQIKDSAEMHVADWIEIVQWIQKHYKQFDGFLILHGTDTMSYTASALSFMLENLSKPVILTGSQLPIKVLRSDAKENILTSLELICQQHKGVPLIQEVCIYFEYQLMRGNRTTKLSSEQFNAFISPNYPVLANSGVHLNIHHNHLQKKTTKSKLSIATEMDASILVIHAFPNGSIPDYTTLQTFSFKAIVLVGFGIGTFPFSKSIENLLTFAKSKKIMVVMVSQCIKGRVELGKYSASIWLKKFAVQSSFDMTLEATITKLMYLLGKKWKYEKRLSEFSKNLQGEMSA